MNRSNVDSAIKRASLRHKILISGAGSDVKCVLILSILQVLQDAHCDIGRQSDATVTLNSEVIKSCSRSSDYRNTLSHE